MRKGPSDFRVCINRSKTESPRPKDVSFCLFVGVIFAKYISYSFANMTVLIMVFSSAELGLK